MKIVITSHGELCEAILKSYQMIAGNPDIFTAIKLDDNGIADFSQRLINMLDLLTQKEPVLVFCDLIGGTPYNESYRYALANPNKIRIVTGYNLPILIEVGTVSATETDIDKLVKIALETGHSSISTPPLTNNFTEDSIF
ncbi:hypothetical protein JMI89_09930 [Frischella sp. Ac48]|uniref:PTS mannose transporter subunit IIAB n=1 Tax=Frischella japonica TaxID=2741544 RepID=A0ABR7QZ47_9GAMM|nr:MULTISPECIES: PTS mannose transporter subunit IIAB [Frischella]MBC9131489.1 PTS mannose transporter subunit IIAB [Frischella japonica]MBX4133943.1 hypothetical protein [Frischella sp. Ac48]